MAKYLTVDLRDHKNILSHLFLNCLTPEIIENIQKKRTVNPDADPNKEKLDITVWIEGVAVDPKSFFDIFERQFDDIVKRTASKMVKEQVSDKFIEISNKLNEYEEITKEWANDINWEIPTNPFQKERIGKQS